ncbi:unnamed protein product [Pleuronectes platessa]|uniref:Uncharacterized protein n=1 Tax=Pleuronectes platessa TaxID=8262 RepID=A0A9N7VP49_PLEPL|nr:unnamed protein product [Pleuronectes platessa]
MYGEQMLGDPSREESYYEAFHAHSYWNTPLMLPVHTAVEARGAQTAEDIISPAAVGSRLCLEWFAGPTAAYHLLPLCKAHNTDNKDGAAHSGPSHARPFHSSSSLGPGTSQCTKQMGVSQRAWLLGKLVSYMADYT